MKIKIIKQKNFDIIKLLRRCGYRELKDRKTGQLSFVHRAGIYFYPRFHLYLEKETPTEIILNLHLDQKRVSYPGCRAHSADYEGKALEKEAERIKEKLKLQIANFKF